MELLRTVQSMSICRLVLRYSDVGDVDVLVCTVDTGDASHYTQDGGCSRIEIEFFYNCVVVLFHD